MRRLAVALVVLAGVGVAPAAASSVGDHSAAATATGAAAQSAFSDFNNDGFADLAVGVPGETIGTAVSAGAVNVLYGSATGPTASGSQFFSQDSTGLDSSAEDFDLFGDALAAGDFNSDGFADLAIGAPGESGSVPAVGGVSVLYGGIGGLTGTGSQFFTQDSPGVGNSSEEADFFGDGLTVGDFNGDGFADLAVGAPGETIGSLVSAGMVNVLYGGTGGLTGSGSQAFNQNNVVVGSAAERNDSFGFVLAAGDFNNDGFADLSVGVPFEASSIRAVGAVNVLYGSAAKLIASGSQFFTQNSPGIGSSYLADESFGAALAAGDFNSDGFADLGVGVPGESSSVPNAGGLNVLYGGAAGVTGSGSQFFTQDSAGVGSYAERNDSFGSAVTAGDVNNDGFADLGVGVPGEASSLRAVGSVHVLYGSAAKLTGSGSQTFSQNSADVVGTSESDDSFGFALAAADFNNDSHADVAIGVPFESLGSTADAGEVDVLFGTAAGLTGSGSQSFSQDTAGVGNSAEEFDWFGFALAAAGPDGPTTVPTPAVGSATMRELP